MEEAYCHRRSFALRCSDVDFKDEIKLSALLSFTQEAASSSADELGFGYEALKRDGRGFIIASTYGEIYRRAKFGETLTVETWPLPPRHVIFDRDYRVLDEKGERIAALSSRWCLVDLARFAMLTPDKLGEVHARCPYRAEKTVETPNGKIPKIGDMGREMYRMRVGNSHCDHYLHANNARYPDFFADCFSEEELAHRAVRAFRIVYVKQAREGDELSLLRKDGKGESFLEARAGGETLTQFHVMFQGGATS